MPLRSGLMFGCVAPQNGRVLGVLGGVEMLLGIGAGAGADPERGRGGPPPFHLCNIFYVAFCLSEVAFSFRCKHIE